MLWFPCERREEGMSDMDGGQEQVRGDPVLALFNSSHAAQVFNRVRLASKVTVKYCRVTFWHKTFF